MIKPECINLYDENGKETSFQDRIYRTDKISAAITAGLEKMAEINLLGGLPGHERKDGVFQTGYTVYSQDGISPTVLANGGGYGIMVAVRQIGNFSESKRSNPNTNRVYDKSGLSPTLNTMQGGNRQPMVVDEVVMNEREYKSDADEQRTRYRIRKLTCREVWRLMGFSDSDFEKAAYIKEIFHLEGDKEKCNAKLKIVKEKQKLTNTATYVLCTINDSIDMEILKIIKKLLAETQESEKMQNVNFVITKSASVELLECATNITKCITFMGMRCILTEEKDQQDTVIIVQEKKDKPSIAKSMKITTESNLNPLKLYIILILTVQIMKLGIYGSSTLQANIKGVMTITENCENSILLKILNLRMENIYTRVSSSQLYKQAGNSIVKDVLMAIFRQMNIKGVEPWNK